MDSRHQFPLAWFLFFNAESVRLVPNTEYDDLYLVREWNEAKADFLRRAPMLLRWFEKKFVQEEVDLFLVWLESLRDAPNEQFLVADSSGLDMEMEDEHAPAIRAALALLDDSLASESQKYEALDVWCDTARPVDFHRLFDKVFGAYYGPLSGDAFVPRAFRSDEAA